MEKTSQEDNENENDAKSKPARVASTNPITVMVDIAKEEGAAALLAGSIPRALRAVGSGAIQFASYELTKNTFR